MLHICVCDDEVEVIDYVVKLLKEWNLKNEISIQIHTCTSGEELIKITGNQSMDILLLDIQMDGMGGMEAARVLREKNNKTILIFLTSFWENVFKSFRVHAFRYVLKKEMDIELIEAMDAAMLELGNKEKYFTYTQKKERMYINYKDILYFESSARKIYMYIKNEESPIIFYERLSEIISRLDYKVFVRCHQGYVANIYNVKNIKNSLIAISECDLKVPVSTRYYKQVEESFLWSRRA